MQVSAAINISKWLRIYILFSFIYVYFMYSIYLYVNVETKMFQLWMRNLLDMEFCINKIFNVCISCKLLRQWFYFLYSTCDPYFFFFLLLDEKIFFFKHKHYFVSISAKTDLKNLFITTEPILNISFCYIHTYCNT